MDEHTKNNTHPLHKAQVINKVQQRHRIISSIHSDSLQKIIRKFLFDYLICFFNIPKFSCIYLLSYNQNRHKRVTF